LNIGHFALILISTDFRLISNSGQSANSFKKELTMRSNIGCIASMILLLALSAATAFAQERVEGRGFFMAGVQGMDIGDLNSRLRANGYGEFSETFASFGGGGYGINGRFLIGGEGTAVIAGGESATIGGEYFKTSLGGGYGLFKLGYIIYRRDGFILYPSFGIGGGGIGLDITQEATIPFDQHLQNPRRKTSLSSGFFLIDLGLGADRLVTVNRKGDEEGGIVFGIHAGYLLAPFRSDWGDALNGPDAAIEGGYVRIIIGGGGSSRR